MDTVYLLPVFETIKLSWQKVKGSKASLWGAYGWVLLTAIILGFGIGFLSAMDQPELKLLARILSPLVSLVLVVLSLGILRLAVHRAFDRPIYAFQVFYTIQHGSLIVKLVCCWLLYMLIMLPFIFITLFSAALGFSDAAPAPLFARALAAFVSGFALAIMIYLLVRLRLAWGFVLDKEIGPWQAIKASFCATRHNFWRLLGLYFLNSIILFLSILPFGLGLIWTLPYLLICYGQVYRQLSEKQN